MTTQTFRYEAVDGMGAFVRGTIESDTAEDAAASLTDRRLVPLSVAASGTGLQRDIKLPGFGDRTKTKDLAIMTRQFASMTAAGLTLIRSLSVLEAQTSKPGLKAALGRVMADVRSGNALSVALARHEDQFPPLMVNMVAAGEAGGFLDGALDRIATMYESDSVLRAKVKSAATYPVVVLIFSVLMMVGVIWFIVPIFEKMFDQLGGQLPLPTRIMVTLSHNLYWILPLVVALAFGAVRGFRYAIRTNEGFRRSVDKAKLRVPVFGRLLSKLVISRWSRTLGALLSVGVPVIQALEMVGGTAGNTVVADAMKDVGRSVRSGSPMSVPLARHPFFPPMVTHMVEVGEETGRTSEMLEKVADFYEDDVKTATDSLTSAMEPLLVVFVGAVIGAMVVCLYLPMFSIYQNIPSN